MEAVAKVYKRKTNTLINIPRRIESEIKLDKCDYVKIEVIGKNSLKISTMKEKELKDE